jgi:hypothetical protein
MANRPSVTSSRSVTAAPDRRRRGPHLRKRRRVPSSTAAAPAPPDLATAAGEAVANFLRDSSAAQARQEAEAAAGVVSPDLARAATPADRAADQDARDSDAILGVLLADPPSMADDEDAIPAPGNAVTTTSTSASLARQLAMPSNAFPTAGNMADSVALQAAAASIATLDRIEKAAAKVEADILTALRIQARLQAGAAVAAETAVRAAQGAWEAADAAVEAETRTKALVGIMIIIIIMIIVLGVLVPLNIG